MPVFSPWLPLPQENPRKDDVLFVKEMLNPFTAGVLAGGTQPPHKVPLEPGHFGQRTMYFTGDMQQQT